MSLETGQQHTPDEYVQPLNDEPHDEFEHDSSQADQNTPTLEDPLGVELSNEQKTPPKRVRPVLETRQLLEIDDAEEPDDMEGEIDSKVADPQELIRTKV